MAFQFKLASVLHLRQSLEHQQELKLRAANQQVARVRHLIEQLDLRRQHWHDVQTKNLVQGLRAAELQFELLCDAELLRHRGLLEQELARQQQLREQQRELFQQARRARETLAAVRDKQLRLYNQDAVRKEQRNLDEMFLLRREYLRHG
jgi:flagellar export protein FliJ